MNIITKTNGYAADELQGMIEKFNSCVKSIFGSCTVEHFYYGDALDMITVRLENKNYGHFNLSAKRVSFSGHTCTNEEYKNFASLTVNDELFK